MTGTSTGAITVMVVVLGLAGCGLLYVWAAGARTGRNIERQIREVSRLGSVLGYALVSAVAIAGVQWVILAHTAAGPIVLALVLGVPALLAGVTVGRLFTVRELRHRPTLHSKRAGARR